MESRVSKSKHVKSRSGCKSCKQKRLKCDETEPACTNCLTRRLSCPGYQQVYKWPSKHQINTLDFSVKSQKRSRPTAESPGSQGQFVCLELSGKQVLHKPNIQHEPGRIQAMTASSIPNDVELDTVNLEPCLEPWNLPRKSDTNHAVVDRGQSDRRNRSNTTPMFDLGVMMDMELYSRTLIAPSPPGKSAILTIELPQTPLLHGIASPSLSDWLVLEETPPKKAPATRREAVRELLKHFYGRRTPVPAPIVQQDTKLVDYYFTNISGIYSCFDSHLNPFRSLVGQKWSLSASMYYTIQSMAAAHLANKMPSMRRIGIELHGQASQHLGQELSQCYSRYPDDDHTLLVLLLIGLSSSWHRPDDLGLPFLRTARSLLNIHPAFNRPGGCPPSEPIQQVFEEGMIYWELMLSFVVDNTDIDVTHVGTSYHEDLTFPAIPMPPAAENPTSQPTETDQTAYDHDSDEIRPHPWTGISPESQMLLAQVGRLVRRARFARNTPNPTAGAEDLLAAAVSLETSLLALNFPPTDLPTNDITNKVVRENTPCIESGDKLTNTNDLITIAHATRDSALLELHRTFPTLPFASPRNPTSPSLSLQILHLLASIPPTSSVHFHQLLPLTIAGSSLRFPRFCSPPSDKTFQITRARGFVRTRLEFLAVRLPAAPVRVVLELLDEVWRRLDAGGYGREVCWLDVMDERGLLTIMG